MLLKSPFHQHRGQQCGKDGGSRQDRPRLLGQAGYAEIYPKIKRDAIICHGILHKRTLSEINDTLFAEGERTLF